MTLQGRSSHLCYLPALWAPQADVPSNNFGQKSVSHRPPTGGEKEKRKPFGEIKLTNLVVFQTSRIVVTKALLSTFLKPLESKCKKRRR